MAIEYREDGTPILTNKSLLSDVPAYTQALADTGLASDVRDSKFNDLLPAEPISPFPIGMIMPYMGSTAPDGWLLCDGREYDSTYFYSLAQVNDSFHSDGTFRVPDMRGRSPIGSADSFGASDANLARNVGLGDRPGDWRTGKHQHWVRSAGSGYWLIAGTRAGNPPEVGGSMHYLTGSPSVQEWLAFPSAHTDALTPTPAYANGVGDNMQPSTGVNFIVYTGRRTLDANGVMLPECGQLPAIAPKTTRDMIEERLAQGGLSEEEVAMLEEHLEAIKEAE